MSSLSTLDAGLLYFGDGSQIAYEAEAVACGKG